VSFFELAADAGAGHGEAKLYVVGIEGNDFDGAGFVVFFAAHDDGELAVDELFADFDHVAVGVVPDEVDLFVLMGGVVGDRGGNLDRVIGVIGEGAEKDVFGVVGRAPHVTGLDVDLRPWSVARQWPGASRSQDQPEASLFLEGVVEEDLVCGRVLLRFLRGSGNRDRDELI
jgi:hypothetical protein